MLYCSCCGANVTGRVAAVVVLVLGFSSIRTVLIVAGCVAIVVKHVLGTFTAGGKSKKKREHTNKD